MKHHQQKEKSEAGKRKQKNEKRKTKKATLPNHETENECVDARRQDATHKMCRDA